MKHTIFAVEDDMFFLDVIVDSLSENDEYIVKGFSTAEECLENMAMNPSIIVLDYYLDRENATAMNGMEALKEIQNVAPNTKVIMLSGQDSLNTAGDLIDLGAFSYVIKDSDAVAVLKRKISAALS